MNDLISECTICGDDKFRSDFGEKRKQCKKCINVKIYARAKKKRKDDINNNKTQKCKECGVEKTITEFPMTKLKCNECCKADHTENVLDSAANNMLSRTPKDNRNPIEYYKKILTELMKNQENKCFYSGELLTVNQGCYNTISPERLNESTRGYNDIKNLRAICQLFQSSSIPVNVEGSPIITSDMRNQILDEPENIQRVSNKHGQNLIIGTVYKKVINFNINFENEDEVKEEMKFLPKMMYYDKTSEAFRVKNKKETI